MQYSRLDNIQISVEALIQGQPATWSKVLLVVIVQQTLKTIQFNMIID